MKLIDLPLAKSCFWRTSDPSTETKDLMRRRSVKINNRNHTSHLRIEYKSKDL